MLSVVHTQSVGTGIYRHILKIRLRNEHCQNFRLKVRIRHRQANWRRGWQWFCLHCLRRCWTSRRQRLLLKFCGNSRFSDQRQVGVVDIQRRSRRPLWCDEDEEIEKSSGAYEQDETLAQPMPVGHFLAAIFALRSHGGEESSCSGLFPGGRGVKRWIIDHVAYS